MIEAGELILSHARTAAEVMPVYGLQMNLFVVPGSIRRVGTYRAGCTGGDGD